MLVAGPLVPPDLAKADGTQQFLKFQAHIVFSSTALIDRSLLCPSTPRVYGV